MDGKSSFTIQERLLPLESGIYNQSRNDIRLRFILEKGESKLKRSDGYIYLDMLAALSICLFIALTLFPIINQIKLDRHNILLRTEAHHILYEKLTAYLKGEIDANSMEMMERNHQYTLTWRANHGFPEMIEGCIHYENAFEETEKICDSTKR